LALDRICFFESYTSFGIAPWNPGAGLSFVLILVFGRQLIPLLFVALLLADVINREVHFAGRNRKDPVLDCIRGESPDRSRPRGPRQIRRQPASLLGIGLSLL